MSERFAVVGTGPGGCATAVLLAELGHEVTVLGRSDRRAAEVAAAGGLTMVEDGAARLAQGVAWTTDPAVAVATADHLVLTVPTSSLPSYARLVAPALRPDGDVLLAPGHTGGALSFRHALAAVRPELAAAVPVAETCTLPFVTRMTRPAEVTVWRRTENLLTGALPATAVDGLVSTYSEVFPSLRPVASVLHSSLANLNAVLHPPGMVGNVGWIEATGGAFRYYSEGVTPGIAAVMDAIDAERLAVGAAYGVALDPFIDMFHSAGLATDEAWEARDTYLAVHTSAPNTLIQSPTSMTDRYVVEDVGSGLVALAALGDCAGVETPIMDALVTLAGLVNRTDYFAVGTNAEAMGIAGLDRDGVLERVAA